MKLGYVAAMAAPHNAAIQQAAQIAQAAAAQAAAEAQQESLRKQAEYERETAVTKAGYAAETQSAEAKASQAGPLAQAQAQREVIDVQTDLARRQAELRQQQLVAEVVKPAEAEADRVRILAKADAERTEIQAAAAASNNRVALDQLLIQQLPLIVEKAAAGLSSANVTVLNGSDGLSEIVSGLVGQGLAIFDTIRGNVGASTTGPSAGAHSAEPRNALPPGDRPHPSPE